MCIYVLTECPCLGQQRLVSTPSGWRILRDRANEQSYRERPVPQTVYPAGTGRRRRASLLTERSCWAGQTVVFAFPHVASAKQRVTPALSNRQSRVRSDTPTIRARLVAASGSEETPF